MTDAGSMLGVTLALFVVYAAWNTLMFQVFMFLYWDQRMWEEMEHRRAVNAFMQKQHEGLISALKDAGIIEEEVVH